MTTWIEKNKVFILTLIVVIVPVILLFGSLQIQADQNAKDIIEVDAFAQTEAARSKRIDADRQEQVARIEEKLSNLETRSLEVKTAVDKTNDKVDDLRNLIIERLK